MIKLENIDVTFKQGIKVVNAVKCIFACLEPGDIYGTMDIVVLVKSTLVND